MGIRVRLCSDWCLREADILSDYPQTSVSCIVRTQYPYFAQRYAGITGFGPILVLLLNFYLAGVSSAFSSSSSAFVYSPIWNSWESAVVVTVTPFSSSFRSFTYKVLVPCGSFARSISIGSTLVEHTHIKTENVCKIDSSACTAFIRTDNHHVFCINLKILNFS